MIDTLIIAAVTAAIGFVIGRLTVRGCTRSHVPDIDILTDARKVVAHVGAQFPGTSGEYKRAQALRMLLNRNPEARERDCAFAIELAVREAS